MKKVLALLLVCLMVFALVACATDKPEEKDDDPKSEGVMTYAEYVAAKVDDPVVIEAYVQAHQSWWDNKITVYAQDRDGAYFIYEMACTEENAAKLVPGTKIKVTGTKSEWAGEVEIVDATFEIIPGKTYVAPVFDATSLLGTDDLIKHQNEFVSFDDMVVTSIQFKNDEPGDDIYVNLKKGGKDYSFCVEFYLTGTDTDVYKAVSALKKDDVIDVEGFLYWYESVNTHITKVTLDDPKSEGVMSYSEYVAASSEDDVVIEAYVQAHQSWWDNKITVYAQDKVGAYFIYEMACTEENAAKLVPGTKIKVTGTKGEWAGEVEIVDATFEIIPGKTFTATALDVTSLLGTDDLIKHQNEFVSFKDMTVSSIQFKNDEPGDDIYVNLKKGDADYSFCVEFYLTGTDTDVYKAVSDLKENDVIDVEGFLYWYEGVNTHITSVTKK